MSSLSELSTEKYKTIFVHSACVVAKCVRCFFQAAAEYWLSLGVDGIKVSDLGTASTTAAWAKLQAAVQTNRTKDNRKR